MPVSVRRSPFSSEPNDPVEPAVVKLRASQVRVLTALQPDDPTDPVIDWPLFTRATMRSVCGLSPTNSMNRILHGVRDGSGKHPGLIEMGLVEEIQLDIDGVTEYNYRITPEGIACLSRQSNADDHK